MKPWSTSIRHTGDYIVQVDEPGFVKIKKLRQPTFWELVLSGGWADFKYNVIYDGDISELTYLANTASNLHNRNDRL